jgi:hypothetical protein
MDRDEGSMWEWINQTRAQQFLFSLHYVFNTFFSHLQQEHQQQRFNFLQYHRRIISHAFQGVQLLLGRDE